MYDYCSFVNRCLMTEYNEELTSRMIFYRLQSCYREILASGIDYRNESEISRALKDAYNNQYNDTGHARLFIGMKEFLGQESFRRSHPKLHSYRLWYAYYKALYDVAPKHNLRFDGKANYMSHKYLYDTILSIRCITNIPYSSSKWIRNSRMHHPASELSDRSLLVNIASHVLHQRDAYFLMEALDKMYGYEPFIPSDDAMQILVKHILLANEYLRS